MFGTCLLSRTKCPFYNHLAEEERAGGLTLIVFLIESVLGLFLTAPCVGLQCAMACGNSWPYSLTFLWFL